MVYYLRIDSISFYSLAAPTTTLDIDLNLLPDCIDSSFEGEPDISFDFGWFLPRPAFLVDVLKLAMEEPFCFFALSAAANLYFLIYYSFSYFRF